MPLKSTEGGENGADSIGAVCILPERTEQLKLTQVSTIPSDVSCDVNCLRAQVTVRRVCARTDTIRRRDESQQR